MKRIGNIWDRICSLDNLRLADELAQRGKSKQRGVRDHNLNQVQNIVALQQSLIDHTYTTSQYRTFLVRDPKERLVSSLPYIDRVVHYAGMNLIEPVLLPTFTADTYSCIKGRGVGGFDRAMKSALRDPVATKYYLKVDVRKFYESIDHDILKAQLRRKIKDLDALWLLDDIIDSCPGIPIGNHISSLFANFTLSPLDHFIKEVLGAVSYFRYCDDMIILAPGKPTLHRYRVAIQQYLAANLNLQMKDNYRVSPVSEGLDVCGSVYFHGYSLMRKSIKKKFARAVASGSDPRTIAAYWGWASHCNTNHLVRKLFGSKEQMQKLFKPAA